MTASPPMIGGYSYLRPLGSGGFADVYLYEQDMPRRITAVKVLHADTFDAEALRTFNVEADTMARLSAHPSIVTIYHASISADGRPYLVMEFCPDTMGARMKRGPLPIAEVLDAGVRLAGALETAHRAGFLHRDIKPSNVLVTTLGQPVLADFGIAAALNAEEGPEVFAMSVPWSSPEVLSERVSGSVPSEIWSLGATLYTLLAGRSPFESPKREENSRDALKARVIRAKYTPLPFAGVPPRVDEILATAMSKDPARRYASMADFGEALRWAQYELGIAPTALEVAAPEWAAAAPIDFSDGRSRGPVVTTVNPDSRRAERTRKQLEGAAVDRDGLFVAAPKRSALGPAVIGALVGAVVVAAGTVAALFATGVL
ncbi:serine/threonine-protein kinase [Agromyces seonyuensis]|nr:serine/threonine-protein kinase [Agromyces seonyuensis]